MKILFIENWIKHIKNSRFEGCKILKDVEELYILLESGCEDALPILEEKESEMINLFSVSIAKPKSNTTKYMEIQAGVGGEDAKDIREKMELAYLKIKGIQKKDGKLTIKNDELFSKICVSENGVHKVVRLSPFTLKRQTSFINVRAFQKGGLDEIDEEDIKFETCKSSGKGGQHANKTESAVRATYTPFGISVRIEDTRSQHKNKELATKKLKERIQEHMQANVRTKEKDIHTKAEKPNWGNTFVKLMCLYPDKYIKDLRSNYKFRRFTSFGEIDYALAIENNIKEIIKIK